MSRRSECAKYTVAELRKSATKAKIPGRSKLNTKAKLCNAVLGKSRSRSRSRSPKKLCHGVTLVAMRKEAKSCGLRPYSKVNKPDLCRGLKAKPGCNAYRSISRSPRRKSKSRSPSKKKSASRKSRSRKSKSRSASRRSPFGFMNSPARKSRSKSPKKKSASRSLQDPFGFMNSPARKSRSRSRSRSSFGDAYELPMYSARSRSASVSNSSPFLFYR